MKFLILIFFFLSFNMILGQSSSSCYVQFKVVSIKSESAAKNIDKKMLAKKGIISTHTDHLTSTYFCTMSGEVSYVFDDFKRWFQKMGYGIVCFNKGTRGDSRMVSPHELKNCQEMNN